MKMFSVAKINIVTDKNTRKFIRVFVFQMLYQNSSRLVLGSVRFKTMPTRAAKLIP